MNIGIFAYRQTPYISANTAIAYTLGEEFRRQGIRVVYIGRMQDEVQKTISEYHGIKICWLNDETKTEWSRTEYYLMRAKLYKIALQKDINSLRTIVQEQKLDGILCITAPNENAMIVAKSDLRIPKILFQLDPFYNHNDIENIYLKHVFQSMLRSFQYVFTTELLMDGYCEDPSMEGSLSNMEVAQFPKLIKRTTSSDIKSENTSTRLLYAGSLYKPVRDPFILSSLKQCLPKEMEVVFCGGCNKEDENELERSGVIYKGYCTQDDLSMEMERADVLINIGNTVKNQLGSKLVDYIATGKPILNIIQISDCATQKLLADYNNHFSVFIHDINKRREDIVTFINGSKGCILPWEEIKCSYRAYTPEYVARQILSHF